MGDKYLDFTNELKEPYFKILEDLSTMTDNIGKVLDLYETVLEEVKQIDHIPNDVLVSLRNSVIPTSSS